MFIGGCGRFFEGTAEQMTKNFDKISKLPKNTLIYCGHEYTLQNYLFCKSIEPKNQQLLNQINMAKQQRSKS